MNLEKLKSLREAYESAETGFKEALSESNKKVKDARVAAQEVYDATVAEAKEQAGKEVKLAQEKLHAKQKEFMDERTKVVEELQKANIDLAPDDLYTRRKARGEPVNIDELAKWPREVTIFDRKDMRDLRNWPNIPLWIDPTWFRKGRDITISDSTDPIKFTVMH